MPPFNQVWPFPLRQMEQSLRLLDPKPLLRGPTIKVQHLPGRRIETTFDSQGRPVERQTYAIPPESIPGPECWPPSVETQQ